MSGPTKITLKSQTNMTLNARFTAIMKSAKPLHASSARSSGDSGGLRPASEKNRRLAAQMEKRTSTSSHNSRRREPVVHRPTVNKRREPEVYRAPVAKHQSVMERLGSKRSNSHVTARLNYGSLNRGPISGRISKPYSNNTRGSFRGSRGRGGRGRGISRGGYQATSSRPRATKDELDNALDSYMKETKKE